MAWRKTLAGILVIVAASPAWGGSEPLGNITFSNASTVRDTTLTPGSTVFSGDTISVGERGATRISLASGAQAEILSNSSVRLAKSENNIQMFVNRGQASFHTSGGVVNALVANATVRPLGAGETSAIIQSLSETHALVAAEKGSLVITTSNDGKSYTLSEGQAADLTLALGTAADAAQDGGAAPAGKAAPSISVKTPKKAVIWTVVVVGAGAAVTAYLLSRRETTQSTTTLQNEISPHSLN